MLTSVRRISLIGLVSIVAIPVLSADQISFDLSVPNSALTGFPGPYATVTVNRTSTTMATITVQGDSSGGFTYILGGNDVFGAQFSGAVSLSGFSFTGGCTGAGCPAGGSNITSAGSGNVDGFGVFNATLSNNDGFQDAVTSLSFTATLSSGSWANAGAVLTPNSTGSLAAAHVFATGTSCNGACVTGYAGSGGSTPSVPEPSAVGLFGTGLFAAAYVVRKRLLA